MQDKSDYKRNENLNLGQRMENFIKINRAKQDSFDMEEVDDEWDENCIEIEEINDKDKGYVSCEEKDNIFLTERDSPEDTCIVNEPIESNVYMSSPKDQYHVENNTFSEYPIKNLIRYKAFFSSYNFKIIFRIPQKRDDHVIRSNQKTVFDGWHGPVVQKTRPAPKRCFGKLELATTENYSGMITPILSRKNSFSKTDSKKRESSSKSEEERKTPLLARRNSLTRRDGWIEIPIQRL